MGILGHIPGTALCGGLFGLLGNLAAKLFAYLEARQQFTQRQTQWAHRADLLKSPAPDAPEPLAPNESPQPEAAIGQSYRWVNAVRALVRPLLTCGLTAVLAVAFFAMKAGDPERSHVIDSLVFAGVGAIAWWFGDRAPKRRL